mgnify:CR=1 FL=1
MLLAVDPGTRDSGYVLLSDACDVVAAGNVPNQQILQLIASTGNLSCVLVEEVAYASLAGWELFRTSWWSGAMCIYAHLCGLPYHQLNRNEVKKTLGLSGKKDADVRRLVIAQYGDSDKAAIGTARSPGPLYAVTGHAWQALGLAVAWHIRQGNMRFRAEQRQKTPRRKKNKTP